jgi:hypothetical protein
MAICAPSSHRVLSTIIAQYLIPTSRDRLEDHDHPGEARPCRKTEELGGEVAIRMTVPIGQRRSFGPATVVGIALHPHENPESR